MRVALLTMLELADAAVLRPRAYLHVGGISVARQQLGLVLALRCERVVCLARALDPELVALQHEAESAGVQFHAIAALRPLSGLVTSADELIALADGLLAEPDEAVRLLDAGPAVLTQPIEAGLAVGFERIDVTQASAGALRIPGRLVERLTELPGDVDPVSALTRIALQAGIAQRQIAVTEAGSARWSLVRNDNEAHAIEPVWIARRLADGGSRTPGSWLSRLVARRFGPALLHAVGGKRAVSAGAGIGALLGMGAGWFGFVSTGLILCGVSWIIRNIAQELEQVERRALLRPEPRFSLGAVFDGLLDLGLIALAGWGAEAVHGDWWIERYFAPAMLVALTRLVPRALGTGWSRWLEDRALLALALAAAQLSGYAGTVHHAAAVVLALAGLLLPRAQRG